MTVERNTAPAGGSYNRHAQTSPEVDVSGHFLRPYRLHPYSNAAVLS